MPIKKIITEDTTLTSEDSGYLLQIEKTAKIMLRGYDGVYSINVSEGENCEIESENEIVGIGRSGKNISIGNEGYCSILTSNGKNFVMMSSENVKFN